MPTIGIGGIGGAIIVFYYARSSRSPIIRVAGTLFALLSAISGVFLLFGVTLPDLLK